MNAPANNRKIPKISLWENMTSSIANIRFRTSPAFSNALGATKSNIPVRNAKIPKINKTNCMFFPFSQCIAQISRHVSAT